MYNIIGPEHTSLVYQKNDHSTVIFMHYDSILNDRRATTNELLYRPDTLVGKFEINRTALKRQMNQSVRTRRINGIDCGDD